MKSILFNDEMVRAILDGRKTKTRRPLKPQPDDDAKIMIGEMGSSKGVAFIGNSTSGGHVTRIVSPYGQVGDRLWIRETFCLEHQVESDQPPPFTDGRPILYLRDGIECSKEEAEIWIQPHYRATDPTPELSYEDTDGEPTVKWKPSIHIPRWASRITLEIVDVRIERVQEITEEEARKEGIIDGGCINCGRNEPCGCPSPKPDARDGFANLWEKMYAKKGFGWYDNPWVWVIDFEKESAGFITI